MSNNILNPLEKELLIRLYRSNPDIKLSDFCRANNVSEAAFKTWLKKYGAEGLSGLYRSKKTPSLLPEGVDETEETLRRELIKTRIELERLKKRLHPDPERRWDAGRVRACIREECAIIEALSKEFPVTGLCSLCGVSRSGFYKWRKRGGDPPKDRAKVLRLVQGCHDAHPSHGYRWVHAYLKRSDGITVSAEYVRRCFLYLGIRAETKHQKKDRERKARDPYPNLIFSTWETVDRPRQVIVSDMTAFWTRSRYWELALYFDVFTKQIIGRGLTKRRGWPGIYHDGLEHVSATAKSAERATLSRRRRPRFPAGGATALWPPALPRAAAQGALDRGVVEVRGPDLNLQRRGALGVPGRDRPARDLPSAELREPDRHRDVLCAERGQPPRGVRGPHDCPLSGSPSPSAASASRSFMR